MLRAIGDTVVASPPLVMTHAEVDELIEKLGRTLDETEHDMRALQSARSSGDLTSE